MKMKKTLLFLGCIGTIAIAVCAVYALIALAIYAGRGVELDILPRQRFCILYIFFVTITGTLILSIKCFLELRKIR